MFLHQSGYRRARTSYRIHATRKLRFESLEARLALTWAGIPPTAITPPSGALTVTLNSQNDAVGAATIATTEVDYYSFTPTSSGSYAVSATTPSSSVDTVIGIFNANGQRLAYNDDISYPSNTDSRLTLNLSAGSRYYLGVTNYSSASRGSYNWSIDGPATAATDDVYENNDSLGTAYNLGNVSATQTFSSLVMADSQDWYRFTTTATGAAASAVSINFQNTQGNLQLALYNSTGTLLVTSQGTGNSESVSLSGRVAGTYYVRVYGDSGATNSNYTLTVTPPTVSTTPSTGGFQITLSMSGLTASQQSIFNQAADRWEQIIVGDLPNATYRGQAVDDLLINTSSVSIDGVNGVLGQAGPDALRSGSRLPYHGVMEFDSADLASMEHNGTLLGVVMHEIGHILGIGTIWSSLGLLSGAGTSNPIFVGAQARAAYNQMFGTNANGVPVENSGGSGTRDSHWRESILQNEIMTGWVGPGMNLPVSRITVASLADIGYTVNFAAADSFPPSSSALASATTSSRSTSTSARLIADIDASESIAADLGSASSATRRQATNRTVFSPPAVQPNRAAVDAVMASASRPASASHASLFNMSDDWDSHLGLAWDELSDDWSIWSSAALS